MRKDRSITSARLGRASHARRTRHVGQQVLLYLCHSVDGLPGDALDRGAKPPIALRWQEQPDYSQAKSCDTSPCPDPSSIRRESMWCSLRRCLQRPKVLFPTICRPFGYNASNGSYDNSKPAASGRRSWRSTPGSGPVDRPVIEVHPEICFATPAGHSLAHSRWFLGGR